jgi:hypothetical protein
VKADRIPDTPGRRLVLTNASKQKLDEQSEEVSRGKIIHLRDCLAACDWR